MNKPDRIGEFYTPDQVAEKATAIARKKNFSKIRISGNEPTLAKKHLLDVISHIPKDILFMLETNGTMIGHDPNYAKQLSEFKNIHVRVSFKGSSPEEFSKLTGAVPEAYGLQFNAMENLINAGVNCHPAVMSFSHDKTFLLQKLESIQLHLSSELEYESLIKYPSVIQRMGDFKI